MSLTQTILIFFAESIFFIAILTATLIFAAKKHRSNLKEVVTQVNKSRLFRQDQEQDSRSSKELLDKLKDKISRMQRQIGMLEQIEQKYYALQEKYKADTQALEERLNQGERPTSEKIEKHTIAVGTTVDRDYGVDPNYLNYLSKKHHFNEAGQSVVRSSHEAKALNRKLEEQRAIIDNLESDLGKAKMQSEIEAIKNEKKDAALQTLSQLEQSLNASLLNGESLEANLAKIKNELKNANEKLSINEMKQGQSKPASDKNADKDSDKIDIKSTFNKKDDSEEKERDDLEIVQLQNERIKQEVEILRRNTTQQRQLIFTLEKEILVLRKDLKGSDFTDDEKQAREQDIIKLERLLQETEGCVEVLESEVSYLQEKLTNLDENTGQKNLQELYENTSAELNRTQKMVERATDIRARLGDILRLARLSDPKEALEKVSQKIMGAFATLDVAVHLKIVSQYGEIDANNSKKFAPEQVDFLSMSIHQAQDATLEAEDGFIVTYQRIGAFIKAPMTNVSSLGKLRDTINFILLVSNSVIVHIDEKQSALLRQTALKRLVEGVRAKISKLSIQSKYQSDEAKHIFDSLVSELNSSLNTINITENQSQFFNQMIEETKQRMSLLLASEVVVDKSFSDLLDKIERGTVYLQPRH